MDFLNAAIHNKPYARKYDQTLQVSHRGGAKSRCF